MDARVFRFFRKSMRVGIAILFGVAQWLRKTISPSENEKTDYRLTFFLSWCIIFSFSTVRKSKGDVNG